MKQIKFADGAVFECISAFAKQKGDRSVIDIKVKSSYEDVNEKFVDNAQYSIIETETVTAEDNSENTVTNTYDKSMYCVAGAITDNRDGTLNVVMGKKTELEKTQEALDNVLLMMLEG